MTSTPAGYDVFVSPDARSSAYTDLSPLQLLDFRETIDSLLEDPTETNPYVAAASGLQGYQLHDYVMVYGELTITYHFVNRLVVEVNAVEVLPRLSDGEPGH